MQRWDEACLLGGNFDELLEKLHTFAELRAQTHLCDHPELGLVKPAQEQVQVHRGLLNVLPPKGVIDEFQLADVTWEKKKHGCPMISRAYGEIVILHSVPVLPRVRS